MDGFEAPVLQPGKNDNKDIEYRKHEERRRGGMHIAVELVHQEEKKCRDGSGIGPALFEEKRSNQPDFYGTVPEEVDCGKVLGSRGKVLGTVEQEIRNQIVRILTQFMQGQHPKYGVNVSGSNKEKQYAAENLEYSIDSLDEDADIEEQVNPP